MCKIYVKEKRKREIENIYKNKKIIREDNNVDDVMKMYCGSQ